MRQINAEASKVLKMAENNGVEFSGRSRGNEIDRDELRVKLTADYLNNDAFKD